MIKNSVRADLRLAEVNLRLRFIYEHVWFMNASAAIRVQTL